MTSAPAPTPVAPPIAATSRRRRRGREVLRQPLALVGLTIALAWFVIAVAAPLIAPYDPLAQEFELLQSPSREHLFGTDELGRDVLSRVIYGSRLSIPLALLLVTVSATIGGLSGAAAGYFRGITDGVVMRVSDLVFAFPAIILAMVVTAVLGRGVRNAVLAIVIVSWPSYARVVRGLVLSIGDSEYVQSARLLGVSSRSALRREVLPNVAGPVLVLATLDLGTAILLLSGLSFLGLGAQPPLPEWGALLTSARVYLVRAPWLVNFPGLAILVTVLGLNLLGNALRDVLDPRLK